ncbi:small multidrug resistance pump [Amaricoccus macauensis]|uniref:Small multidrug resistance pump n=1 Tax=Amaricoccus macauensis TaxID=57001 RepID=A0A840SM67_9RHOB|nr:SMR family transporter [Amaricoccus macauensis]MBB5220543.1 small multidrug resistance pump [Amaricoccus macauensis]
MSLSTAYLILSGAIICEIIGTSALHASAQFTRLGPSLVVAVCYTLAIVGLAFTFKVIPMGIAYAIWSGLGIVLISVVGWTVFGQRLDAPAVIGLGMIVGGVVVVNVFSGSVTGH